jgi:hypothetical protein
MHLKSLHLIRPMFFGFGAKQKVSPLWYFKIKTRKCVLDGTLSREPAHSASSLEGNRVAKPDKSHPPIPELWNSV